MKRCGLGLYLAWVDMLTALCVVLLTAVAAQSQSDEQPQARGEVRVELHWPDGASSDVDLWVLCPGDQSVGYSNKVGGHCTLDRDDLGAMLDTTPYNFETTRSRGVVAGEYVVNAHLFRALDTLPIPLTVAVYVTSPGTHTTSQVLCVGRDCKDGNGVAVPGAWLADQGEEITVVRFSLTANGGLVAGSVNTLDTPLRSTK